MSELLKVSANISITNKLALTPLAEAVVSGRVDIAQLLFKQVRTLLCIAGAVTASQMSTFIHVCLSLLDMGGCRLSKFRLNLNTVCPPSTSTRLQAYVFVSNGAHGTMFAAHAC